MGSRRLPLSPLFALLLLAPGCASVQERPDAWPGEIVLSDYLPGPEELPEGIVLREHGVNAIGGAPVAYPEGSVERLASQEGWAIFTRVAEREHVGKADWVGTRDFPIQRLVVFVYRRRDRGEWENVESQKHENFTERIYRRQRMFRGELEMAAWIRHADAKRFEIFGGPDVAVVLVQDGSADQVIDSGFDAMAAWFRERIERPVFRYQ
ncbi:MAG: hypothetical protein HY720_28595 [Planctomycetes bacterium]|nr:hypothetical protein [Planctomycetota bacterium]